MGKGTKIQENDSQRNGQEQALDLSLPGNRYYNRELSWLLFNTRILEEARDRQNLLFERLKFLSITASNLDEFFMVRVASLKDMIHGGYKGTDIAGMTAEEQFEAVQQKTHTMVDMQYSTYKRSLLKDLKADGLYIISEFSELTAEENKYLEDYFNDNVYPVLTPMAFDSSRPFPLILNKSLNIAALLKRKKAEAGGKKQKDELEFAMVQAPKVLRRVIELPARQKENGSVLRVAVLLEDLIEYNIERLFSNYDVIATSAFRIMRDADFELDEDEIDDLLEEISKQLKKRRRNSGSRRRIYIILTALWI